MDASTSFTLNGKFRTFITDSVWSLLEVLRADLYLAGTKFGSHGSFL